MQLNRKISTEVESESTSSSRSLQTEASLDKLRPDLERVAQRVARLSDEARSKNDPKFAGRLKRRIETGLQARILVVVWACDCEYVECQAECG